MQTQDDWKSRVCIIVENSACKHYLCKPVQTFANFEAKTKYNGVEIDAYRFELSLSSVSVIITQG